MHTHGQSLTDRAFALFRKIEPALFHDTIYDALNADVAAIGGVKVAAALLFRNHSDAASKLRSCLSIEHPQKLDPDELLALKRYARDAGSVATVTFEAQELGYSVQWVSPEDAREELQRQFIAGVAQLNQLVKRLEK